MNNTKEKRQLNEEPVNQSKATSQKEEKNMKKVRSFVTMVAVCLAMMVVLVGCGTTTSSGQQPEVTVGTNTEVKPTEVVAQPTDAPTPTEKAAEPTEEPTPTEAVVEDNPNIIDGVDFTSFNEEYMAMDFAMSEMTYDSMRVIVEQTFNESCRAVAILKDGDHFVQEEGDYAYHIYAPKPIKSISYSEKTIELNVDGATMEDNYISTTMNEAWEFNGTQFPATYIFWIKNNGMVNDEAVSAMVEYEDGSVEAITVFITKDYID